MRLTTFLALMIGVAFVGWAFDHAQQQVHDRLTTRLQVVQCTKGDKP